MSHSPELIRRFWQDVGHQLAQRIAEQAIEIAQLNVSIRNLRLDLQAAQERLRAVEDRPTPAADAAREVPDA